MIGKLEEGVSIRIAFKRALRAIPFPWNQSDRGSLHLAICLFFFVREDEDSNEVLVDKFRRCVLSSVLGANERDQRRAIAFCMESIWAADDRLSSLREADFSKTIDKQYRKLFLAPLYLRYVLLNDMSGALGMRLIEGALGQQPEVDLATYKEVAGDVSELTAFYALPFHEYATKLFQKGKEIEKDVGSEAFKYSVWGYKSHFGRVPENVFEGAVGFYLAVFGKLHRADQ